MEELQGHGVVVLVLHLHLVEGHVDDGFEGELAGVGPATPEEEDGAKDSEDNAEPDVEEVEPGVDGEEAAALANHVASLLRKVFRSNLLSDGLVLTGGCGCGSNERIVGNISITWNW